MAKMILGDSFMELAKLVPALLNLARLVPNEIYGSQSQQRPLIFQKMARFTLGRSLIRLSEPVPGVSCFTSLVLIRYTTINKSPSPFHSKPGPNLYKTIKAQQAHNQTACSTSPTWYPFSIKYPSQTHPITQSTPFEII